MAVSVKEKAIQLLARREHSKKELTQKLINKGYDVASIADLFEFLHQHDLQSDARFSESYFRYRKQAGFGPRRISLELQSRGVSDALIQSCCHAISTENWRDAMIATWLKKFPNSKNQQRSKLAQQKEYQFLLYRGFHPDMIARWMAEVLKG